MSDEYLKIRKAEAEAAQQSANALYEQNELLQKNIQAQQEAAWDIRSSIDEQNRLIEKENKRKEKEAYDATFPQRKAQLIKIFDETYDFAKKNNFVCVYVSLPKHNNTEYFSASESRNFQSYFKNYLDNNINKIFLPYIKKDCFVDAYKLGLKFPVKIPKRIIAKIKNENIMKEYYLNNIYNMFAINYKGDYFIVSPKSVAESEHDGNPDKEIAIEDFLYAVFLNKDDLKPFLKSCNNFMQEAVNYGREKILENRHYIDELNEKRKKEKILEIIMFIIKKIIPPIIGALAIIWLFNKC